MPAELLMTPGQIEHDQVAWLQHRRQGVTASELAIVLGLQPDSWEDASRFDLFHAKREGWEHEDSEQKAYGRYMEDWVAQRFAVQYPDLWVMPGGLYRNSDRPWQMATYDRLAYEGPEYDGANISYALGCIECKTANISDAWGEPGSSQIPDYYMCQVLGEMDVADFSICYLPVMFHHDRKVRVYVVERDAGAEANIRYLRECGLEFMAMMESGEAPPVDWRPATTRALKRLHPTLAERNVAIPKGLARRYYASREAVKRAEQRRGQAINEILQRMGDARYAVIKDATAKDGERKLATRSRYPVEEHIVRGYEVDKLQPSRWKP